MTASTLLTLNSSLGGFKSAPAAIAASRAEMADLPATPGFSCFLAEGNRAGSFIFTSGNFTALVAADTAQGIYVAPSSDPTGASGAWVRQFYYATSPLWFGFVLGNASGANAAANNAAWLAYVATLGALRVNATTTAGGVPAIELPLGLIEFSQPLDFNFGQVHIFGKGGNGVVAATILKFYGCTGVRVQSSNTSGASTKDGVLHMSGTKSVFENFAIIGDYVSGAEAENYGFHGRATFVANNVTVQNFAGEAWRIEADTGALGGDATCWRMNNCEGWGSRNGIYEKGNNTSAGKAVGGIFNNNRQWGDWNSCTLGSPRVGVEFANNGITSLNDGVTIGATIVSDGTNRYGCIVGQEVGASTNAPSGTTADNTWWYYIGAGAAGSGIPLWTSGILVRSGGCVKADQVTSPNGYYDCYAEANGGTAQVYQKTVINGGTLAQYVYYNPSANKQGAVTYSDTTTGNFVAKPGVTTYNVDQSLRVDLGGGVTNSNNIFLKVIQTTYAPSGWNFGLRAAVSVGDMRLDYGGSDSQVPYWVTGPSTPQQFGTGAAVPYAFAPLKTFIADNSANLANCRRVMIDTAAPASGAHAQGEFTFNRSAALGQPFGWKCTVAGTPGTWVAQYAVQSLTATSSGLTMSTSRLLGRTTAATGAIEEISVGSGLGFSAGSLAVSGAATASGLTMSTARMLGRTTASTGAIEEIAVGAGLTFSGGTLAVSQAAHQADSTAPDVATLVTDFNALLAKLQAAGLMV